MKLTWASIATGLGAISAAFTVMPYGWAHVVAASTSAAAVFLTGTYVVMNRSFVHSK